MRTTARIAIAGMALAAMPFAVAATPAGCSSTTPAIGDGDPGEIDGYANAATPFEGTNSSIGPLSFLTFYNLTDVMAEDAGNVTVLVEWTFESDFDLVVYDAALEVIASDTGSGLGEGGGSASVTLDVTDCTLLRVDVENFIADPLGEYTVTVSYN